MLKMKDGMEKTKEQLNAKVLFRKDKSMDGPEQVLGPIGHVQVQPVFVSDMTTTWDHVAIKHWDWLLGGAWSQSVLTSVYSHPL